MTDDPLAAAMNADPRSLPWGIRSSSAAHEDPAVFYWFETEQDLRQSLIAGHHATELSADQWKAVHMEYMRETLVLLVDPITPNVTDVFDSMELPFEVSWCGHYDDLLAGNSTVALDLRRDFFAIGGLDEIPPPVGKEQGDAFVEFVRTWSL